MSTLPQEFLDLQAALAGEFSLERELGRGGMGVVLLARDVLLDRQVAIKVLAPHLASDRVARERFLREARTAARLSHPNIVPIHRVGTAGDAVFFVMSYVPGETLAQRIRSRGPLPPAEAMRMVREVAWALAYAHGRGVVHRDIKPDNILLEEGTGRALVTDFGIARIGDATLSSDPGTIIGTAQFMSPEQAMNDAVDGRSDLYALGIVAYVAVSGRLPFEAASVPALLMQQVSATPPPVAQAAPGTPAALAAAIHRCLEKEPAKRFATGEELAESLAPPAEGRPALPARLRTWLSERNPAMVFYAAWSGLLGIPMLYDVSQLVNYGRAVYVVDLIQLGVLAAAPLIPIVGFHVARARRLFRDGYTLADLRGALDVAERERRETEALDPEPALSRSQRALRVATYATVFGSGVLTFLADAVHLALERRHIVFGFDAYRFTTLTGWIASVVLLGAMNVKQVPVLPAALRRLFRGGLRERLWRGRIGAFFARRLGAGASGVSRPAIGAFQPTEHVLVGAADELYAALPTPYRETLRELPSLVRALETQASEARTGLQAFDAIDADATADAVAGRRAELQDRLARSVAALESIRIELLRLHAAGAGADVTSLTTLLERARVLGDDLARLTAAHREVQGLLSPDDARAATPA